MLEDGEGNMGLLDRMWMLHLVFDAKLNSPEERLALSWVQKYIGQFGGDKSRVML